MKPTVYVAYGIESRLCVEGIVASFKQKEIGTAFEKCFCLLSVGFSHFVERDAAMYRLAHVGSKRQRLCRRSHGTGHENSPVIVC